MTADSMVGRVGIVVNGIRGGTRPGEIRLMVDGIAHYYLAYAVKALPAGTDVLVTNNRGARQVDVEPWPLPPMERP